MIPKNQNKTCPDLLSNDCVVWQGGDVPSLGICNGQSLSETEYILATNIVTLFSDIDMSTIDISCLQEACAQKCKDNSLKAIIQVLFDNQCCLTDLVNSINAQPPTVQIAVNLRCLKKFDDFGNEIPQDLNQSLQSIVNQVCTNVLSISSLQAETIQLQKQIDAIPPVPDTPPEPTIKTCLTPGLRPVSQVVPLVAQALCDFETAVGTIDDMSIASSQQCPNLNSLFAGVQGWLANVANLSQSMNNLWILACNLNDRISVIEENCCKLTCKDVEIGFDVQLNTDGTGVFLKFTAGAGTNIPSGFVDCGSSVQFTDVAGQYVTYPLIITNNANLGDFDLSGLNLDSPVTIAVTSIMCTQGLTCQKCITKLYTLTGGTCPVCPVVASGTEGSVTITFIQAGGSTTDVTSYQVLTLGPAQTGYIPKFSTIISIDSTGDVVVNSDCISLTPPPKICYVFRWEEDPELITLGPVELSDATFVQLQMGTINYDIDSPYYATYIPTIQADQALFDELTLKIPAGVLKPACVLGGDKGAPGQFYYNELSVQVPNTLAAPVLKVLNPFPVVGQTPLYIYLKGEVSSGGSDCQCSSSTSEPGSPPFHK